MSRWAGSGWQAWEGRRVSDGEPRWGTPGGCAPGLAGLAAVGGGCRLVGLALLASASRIDRLDGGAVACHPMGAGALGRRNLAHAAGLRRRRARSPDRRAHEGDLAGVPAVVARWRERSPQ